MRRKTPGTFVIAAALVGAGLLVLAPADASELIGISHFGTRAADEARGGTTDAAGNTYVVGSTRGAFAGEAAQGCQDAFVAKLNPSGDVQWVRQFGTTYTDAAESVAVDAAGVVYVAGFNARAQSARNDCNGEPASGFLYAFDPNGDLRWQRNQGDYADGVAVHEASLFVTSRTAMSRTLARYTADSSLVWQSSLDIDQAPSALAVDATGVYLAGWTYTAASNGVDADGTIVHVSLDGSAVSSATFGDAANRETLHAIARRDGATFVGGTRYAASSQARYGTAFVARVDSGLGWSSDLAGRDAKAWSLATDDAGRVYAAGTTSTVLRRSITDDAYVWSLRGDGSTISTTLLATNGMDGAAAVSVGGGVVNAVGFTTGSFCKRCSRGGSDAFLATLTAG